ncbi:hypothetical protein [Tianweitania sp.]|uniref:hypothetical protein n=1 Tax=Tianweitania sp. TaxID=2021634 RepID=UPI0028A27C6D|nr:hypothetical protein [Tianweitania sp.]
MFHVKALLTLSKDVPYPKSDGVRTGYDPYHKFPGVDYLATGFHTYTDDQIHYPGESLIASIVFPSWEFFGPSIHVGDVFEIRELDKVVGRGVVQAIAPA